MNLLKKNTFLLSVLTISFILSGNLKAAEKTTDKPNILWITAEDMSPVLGCYGDPFAMTPNLDQFAKESVLYTNAFSTAPVCSPSRSCLINGLQAPSQGTQQMRSAFPIPNYMTGFPGFLKQNGYYTSNNVKTDYNSANWKQIIQTSWNESSPTARWTKRKNGQPFFTIINLMTSHQSRSMVWPYERFVKEVQSKLTKKEIHDPAKVPLPPYYVDTPIVRKHVARFYDCVTAMDKEVGAILKKLEADGLADDTIVFFYSDHGSGMPRHKRALLDSGMRIAMMIRFPEKYKHLAPGKPGSKTDRLISFEDFGPSVLSLTETKIPAYMEGKAFLGKDAVAPRHYVYGHRDRVDEVSDLGRCVRDKRFLYIRNYMPHMSYNQPTAWPDLGEIRHEFYRLTNKEKMTAPQWHFAGPSKPVEELYDSIADPMNLNNLVNKAAYKKDLVRLRARLTKRIRDSKDLGFIPEALAWELTKGTTPYELARSGSHYNQQKLLDAASLVGVGTDKQFIATLESNDPGVRYWGAVGFSAGETLSADAKKSLVTALSDQSVSVRIEAAGALLKKADHKMAIDVLAQALTVDNLAAVLHAARTIELLGSKAKVLVPAMKRAHAKMLTIRPPNTPATVVQPGRIDMAMFIGFSTKAFLAKQADEKSRNDGQWVSIFDGKTLTGWKASVSGDVQVVDGEIRILSKGKNLWLLHEKVYKNFEIEMEALMPTTYNSGLGFRCKGKGKKPLGYQCEIDGKKSGAIYAIGQGWVLPANKKFFKTAGDCFKNGQWNKFRVRCEGDHIQIWINGHQTTDIHDRRFQEGSFALQHHGKGDVHRFRNIRVKEIK